MTQETVKKYYDYTLPFYRLFWYGKSQSYALHYGLWFPETRTLDQALQNTNKFMAEIAGVKAGDKVLDAGCGVGGSSIWLAKNVGALVTGITISKGQRAKARQLAKRQNVEAKTKFLIRDYLKTGFPSQSFNVVWAIESVCHAPKKIDFLKEARRLLKKGGRIVICDGFKGKEPETAKERQIYHDFCRGLALPGLDTVDQFTQAMRQTGFSHIKFYNLSPEVMPSSKRIYSMSRWGKPISLFLEKIHLVPQLMTDNCQAGIVQYEAMKCGVGTYGIFAATT